MKDVRPISRFEPEQVFPKFDNWESVDDKLDKIIKWLTPFQAKLHENKLISLKAKIEVQLALIPRKEFEPYRAHAENVD